MRKTKKLTKTTKAKSSTEDKLSKLKAKLDKQTEALCRSLREYVDGMKKLEYVDKHSKTQVKEYLFMLVSEIQYDIDTAFKNEYYELVTATFGEKL
jgi:hypothetical protein